MITTDTNKKTLSKDHLKSSLNGKNIRIRMYRVGFGDCFLLSLPTSKDRNYGRYSHILLDCGVHSKGDIGTMQKVVYNIRDETNGKLAVIIATHAHQDHISGFGKFEDLFTKFKVEEVWLPWTWDDNNKKAVNIRRRQAALTTQLFMQESKGLDVDQKAITNLLENLKGNKHSIELLKSGFGKNKTKVRYLKAGDNITAPDISVPGLYTQVLGPPESEEFLGQMNIPSSQRYLNNLGGKDEILDNEPFAQRWRANIEHLNKRLYMQDESELRKLAKMPYGDLAFTLDQAINNESLVTLFSFCNKHLLFTGDAQYGNWRWWLQNERYAWILSKINFFKIAHHGSHNATPKAALEQMSDGQFAAMISTQSEPWESIPRVPLISRLYEKTGKNIVRSDWLTIKNAPGPMEGSEPPYPSKLPTGFYKGDVWFDYLVKIS